MKIPKHIAIIMDGNRRYAKKHKLKSWEGHEVGKKTLKKLVLHWLNTKIENLTVYALSLDNLKKRSSTEKKFLFALLAEGFDELLKEPKIFKKQVNVGFLGRWDLIKYKELRKSIQDIKKATKKFNKKSLNFAIAYDGQDEIVQACKGVVKSKISSNKIDSKIIKKHLYSSKLPPVDLLIRTGGDQRISGFLLWDISYAEFYFTPLLFPSFTPKQFDKAIKEFKKRQRRFGK